MLVKGEQSSFWYDYYSEGHITFLITGTAWQIFDNGDFSDESTFSVRSHRDSALIPL